MRTEPDTRRFVMRFTIVLITLLSAPDLMAQVPAYTLEKLASASGYPTCVALDSARNAYYCRTTDSSVWEVSSGKPTLFAGGGAASNGLIGDGGPANKAELSSPHGIAFDSAGNMYIADSGNNRIRKVSTDGTISTVGGPAHPAARWEMAGPPLTPHSITRPMSLLMQPGTSTSPTAPITEFASSPSMAQSTPSPEREPQVARSEMEAPRQPRFFTPLPLSQLI